MSLENAETQTDSGDVKDVILPADEQNLDDTLVADDLGGEENEDSTTVDEGVAEADTNEDDPKGVQKRINRLTAKANESARVAAAESAERQKTERRLQELEQILEHYAEQDNDAPPQEPVSDDFENWKDFVKAQKKFQDDLRDFSDRKAEKLEGRKRHIAGEQYKASLQERHQGQITEILGEHPDFYTTVANLQISDALEAAILHSKHGAAIAYHLGKNPKEAQALLGMNRIEAALAIGRIESKFMRPPKKLVTGIETPTQKLESGARVTMQKTVTMDMLNKEKDPEKYAVLSKRYIEQQNG